MPASEAQVAANRANAARSTGPETVEGKEASRANAYKHGLTATKVFPEREAAEVQLGWSSRADRGPGGVRLARLSRPGSLTDAGLDKVGPGRG